MEEPQRDLIAEARELLAGADDYVYAKTPMLIGRVSHCEIQGFATIAPANAPPVAYVADHGNARLFARSAEIVSSLCSALEEQQELNRVQAESIRCFQAQEKVYRAAITRMLNAFTPFASEDTERWREEHEAYEAARAAITPKGEAK